MIWEAAKRFVFASLLPLLVPVVLLGTLGGVVGLTGASIPAVATAMNQLDDIPVELREPIQSAAQGAGVNWPLLAAYLKVRYDWRLPGESRIALSQEIVPIIPCSREQALVTCERYLTRDEIEDRWQASVAAWLPGVAQQLAAVGGHLEAPELGLDETQVRQAYDYAEAVREIDALRSSPVDYADFHELTFNESYEIVLQHLDWRHPYPVPGAEPVDSWHFSRPQNPGLGLPEFHQGADLFAPRGTEVLAVTDGLITQIGWNTAGGWALDLTDSRTGVTFYYAHMERYADGLSQYQSVTAGQVIGYVGTSGEGPPGTSDVIQDPHLHFGMYLPAGGIVRDQATNPYPYLLSWWQN